MTDSPAAEEKSRSTRFKPGKSGNPGGRASAGLTELRQRLAKDGLKVADIVLKQALAGDLAACKMVLDRLSPPLKPIAAPVSIALPDDAGIADTARAFVAAAASGDMPADLAAAMVTAVAGLARIIEIDDLQKRIELLEAAQ